MVPSSSLRPVSDAAVLLDSINAASFPIADQKENYRQLSGNERLADSFTLKMINAFEIEGFIPPRMAILLKLNWEDKDFASALLSNIVAELRDGRKGISKKLADHMLSKIDKGNLTEVLYILSACMRCKEGEDLYSQDDIVSLSQPDLIKFIEDKELLQSRNFLEKKIRSLSDTFPNAKTLLTTLLKHLRENNSAAFKAEYINFLKAVAKEQPEGVRKIAFEELKETVEKLQPGSFFISLSRILKTQEFYGQKLVEVVDLTRSLQGKTAAELEPFIERCQKAFQNTLYLLADFKNMPCGSMTAYCLQHGLIRQEWIKINALFERKRHLFCDCHAVKDTKASTNPGEPRGGRHALWPLNQDPFVLVKRGKHHHVDAQEQVAVFGCNWGGGHKQTAINIAEICEDQGMHPVTVDIPDDLLVEQNKKKKVFGFDIPWTTQDVFTKLLQTKAFAMINFLRWLTGMNSPGPLPAEEVKLHLRRMLLINPSVAITTIGALTEPVREAARLMGIPCLHMNTDVDRGCFTRSEPPKETDFKMGIAYEEAVMTPTVSTTERSEQIAVLGPPTKRVYDIERTPAQIEGLRRELEQELGIQLPAGKKLVIVSNGGFGAHSPYPELIMQKYKDKSAEEIPFVVVVLCGDKNEAYFNHVTKLAAHLPQGAMKACRLVQPETMEKLYRVASYGGCSIGKAGGLTVFELTKCGTRLIIDNIPSTVSVFRGFFDNFITIANWILRVVFRFPNTLPWEKINQDFVISQGLATSVTSSDEFYNAFERILAEREPVKMKTPIYKFSERLPQLITGMKARAQADPSLASKRIYKIEPARAAGIL